MPDEMTLPSWVHTDSKPETDGAYFENLTRCIFQAGLSWQLVANKWPNFQSAFEGFDIEKVASYGVEEIKRLTEDTGIIRNKQKINATLHNAREFRRIAQEYGSFKTWLASVDASDNYAKIVRALRSNLKHVGPGTAHIFLWSVGEPIKYDPSVHSRRPKKIV